jgi:hypothetical protein
LETGTLRALKAAEAPDLLSPARSLAILRAVSDSLFPLHAAGRAYGVFGPDSVLVDADGARLAEQPAYDEAYAAPEVRAGGEPTPASDAYSYAALAHRLLAGDAPAFGADGMPLPIAEQHPGFPAFAGEALARALQPDPAKRPLPKVLDTLLQVVPIDRWPAAFERAAVDPAARVPEDEAVLGNTDDATTPPAGDDTVDTTDTTDTADETQATRESAREADGVRQARDEEFRRALAPQHPVPDIEWSHRGEEETDSRALIDWTADADPTRPSHEVPEIRWTPRALHGSDPLTDELPVVEPGGADQLADEADEAVGRDHDDPSDEVLDSDPAVDAETEETEETAETGETDAATAGTTDIRAFLTGAGRDQEPDADADIDPDTPFAELLGEPVAAEEHLAEHVLEGRVRSSRRRRRHHLDAGIVQTVALVAILVLLLAAGMIFFLTHRDGPAYDPTLHGASRSLSHPVAVRA